MLMLGLFINFIHQKITPSSEDNPLGRVYHPLRRASMVHHTVVEKLEHYFVRFPAEKSLRQSEKKNYKSFSN